MKLRSSCLRASLGSVSLVLPDFLVPALSSTHATRPFSSTSRSRSRIGSAPLSIPQGVDLRLLDPPARRKQDVTTTELLKTLEILGPLGKWEPKLREDIHLTCVAGKMTLQLPPYMSLDHDKETRKASLSILDREERKQREMWGMSPLETPLMSPFASR